MKQPTLRPSDVVVACQLTLSPGASFENLSKSTGISAGECHNAVRRLRLSRLLLSDERRPSNELLLQFLVHGVPFAFPPVLGVEIVGVPTGHSSPIFRGIVDSPDVFVWPDADGSARGRSLIPLFPGAAALPGLNPPLYDMLSLIDALRTGTTRVRNVSIRLLAERLPGSAR